MSRSLSLLLSLYSLLISLSGRAQVFIADQAYRDELNSHLPGLVDASGMMDTAHPGIADLTGLQLSFNPSAPVIELNGLEYFTQVEYMLIYLLDEPVNVEQVLIPQCPPALQTVEFLIDANTVTIDGLPDQMEDLVLGCYDGSQPTSFTINDPPSEVDLFISYSTHLHWTGTMNATDAWLSDFNNIEEDLVLPSLTAETLHLDTIVVNDLDLSMVTASEFTGVGSHVAGLVTWPNEVSNISVGFTVGSPLPNWPSTLEDLSFLYPIECIPPFPDGLQTLSGVWNLTCMPNWPPLISSLQIVDQEIFPNTATYCSVLNGTCPGANPGITGRLFVDGDSDGAFDAGESGLPQVNILLEPNGHSVQCQSDGSWEIGVIPGEYTITPSTEYPYIVSVVPTSHAASVPELGDSDVANDFAVTLMSDIQDLRVHAYAVPARPGFDNQVYLHCENYGTTPVDAEVILTFDADQTWVSSSETPATQTGNTATWNFPAMPIGEVKNITVDLNTSTSVALGTAIIHALIADPIATDETPADNTYTFSDSVVGSYDPNDKLLMPSVLSPAQVAQGETPIVYTIRFQNTGTHLAERVVILDTLSEDLQWESMRFIASSHANHWYITDGVLHVIHNDIMLPDSTNDEPGSHGFIQFSMLPKSDLQDGETITNIAHIVFDFNEPIITPPAVFSVDIEAGLVTLSQDQRLSISPNPARDRVQVRCDGTGPMRYRILDVLGAEVQQGKLMTNGWIELGTLQAGPYVLEVEQGGVRTSQRFVKQ